MDFPAPTRCWRCHLATIAEVLLNSSANYAPVPKISNLMAMRLDGIGPNDLCWRRPQLRLVVEVSPMWADHTEIWPNGRMMIGTMLQTQQLFLICECSARIPIGSQSMDSSKHPAYTSSWRDHEKGIVAWGCFCQTKEGHNTLNNPQLCRIQSAESRYFWSIWSFHQSSPRPSSNWSLFWSFSREAHTESLLYNSSTGNTLNCPNIRPQLDHTKGIVMIMSDTASASADVCFLFVLSCLIDDLALAII